MLSGAIINDQYTHKGKSGRVYKSDHIITAEERAQIDKYDAEVEMPKRKPTPKPAAAKPKTFDYSNTLASQKKAQRKQGTGDLRKLDNAPAPTGRGFLSKSLETARDDVLQSEGLRTGNPNYDPSQDSVTDFGRKAPPESRRNFDPKVNRAKDPISNSLPALVATQLVQKAPGMAADALNTLGGGPQMSRETREGINQSPIAAFGKYLIPGVGGIAASVDTAKGAVEALDALGKGDASKAMIELAGNVLLPAGLHGAASYAIPALAKAWKGFRATKNADEFLKAADRVGLDPDDARALVDVPEMPKVPEAPKVETATVETPKVETPDTQGISHAEVDDLRKDMGWQPRNPTEVKPDADLLEESKQLSGRERTVAERVMSDQEGKVTLSDPESVALGNRLKTLKQEMADAKAADDVDKFDIADEEAQRIADALDESGTRQGRAFRARRFLFDGFEDSWTLNRRAKKANLDQPLSADAQKKLDKTIADLETANAELKKERDAAVNSLDLFKSASQSKRSKGPMNAEKRRNEAMRSLRKLGIPTAEDIAKGAPTGGGMKSKQSGAVRIPEGETEQVAKAVRMLVRSYEGQGLDNWDKVLGRLKSDLPGIDEEQALWILSGKYKQAKLEADLAKRNVNRFMSDVNRDAKYRSKPAIMKALQFGVDALSTTQRSLQTTLDNSLALIQGKNVLMWKPGTWIKAVGKSLQAGFRTNPIEFARREMTKMENHPLYARAVKAKLGLSDVDGQFTKQEEFFAGRLENHVPGIANSKAMATVMANQMRFDLFRKLAAAGPDTPEYLEDIATQINIVTGKGTGHIAELLGSKPAGLLSYAPRFYWASWQHNLGFPLFTAKTAAGRGQALKMYGTQLAFYGMAIKLAQEFGYDVELDPRSQNFGVAMAKDGSHSFDLFKKQAEPIRVGAQMIYGKFSKKGDFTKATDSYRAADLFDYAEQKSSPILRMTKMAVTGSTYDDQEGKQRTARVSDFWGSYIPLSIKEMMKNKDKPGTFPASFFGANVDKGQKIAPKRPFELEPPGIKKMRAGK
jgi:hypothetical protein